MYKLLKNTALAASGLSLLGLLIVDPASAFTLTVFHNNDGESALLPDAGAAGSEGGAAEFIGLLNNLRSTAVNPITLSSGDNILAGLTFSASQETGVLYDAQVLAAIGYDAIALGNHDFDFGPDFLANFINTYANEFGGTAPYLSANLDFTGTPLEPLVAAGRIAKSTIVNKGGEQIGIVSAITEILPSISSPGDVDVLPVLAEVQAEIDRLQAQGIDKIILISHLQSINIELDLIPQLSGVDIVIAGGGDELLINDVNNALPSDQANVASGSSSVFGPYPVTATNADGQLVPVVTTPGEYGYLGRLEVEFDDSGVVTSFNGEPVRVFGPDLAAQGIQPDAAIATQVIAPVEAAVAALDAQVIGTTEIELNGVREAVRTTETNLGNLIADSLLWQAQQLADSFGAETPVIALQNGGGIRNSVVIPAGDNITAKDTIDILPFSNFVSVVSDVMPDQLKAIFENAYSAVENVGGAFAQVAGVKVGLDLSAAPGSRVIDVQLDDGTFIVKNGQVVSGAPTIALATIDFLARGGDNYPLADNPLTNVGVSYQQALANYIETGVDQGGLGGVVTAAQYPVGGEGRIFATEAVVPEPGTILGLLGLGAFGVNLLKRRKSLV
ncbi:MAG: PEP-CTERM sorting domain-containing protein [Leptolyngbyaceae cyanobacterium SM1_1_3]|nr:PEP-CTERM sorting domain-containing protein [Leptolyngbyaceae cyanobacterium SM1_1_3]NJN03865.1 PEP-CTERM sorting domain-containing protein [Leptolyngbyaceae cyanobacterium RM1_1_2]